MMFEEEQTEDVALDETDAMRTLALQHLEDALGLVPVEDKLEYLEALRRSPHLVETESDPMRFLRCDGFNPWSAARRIIDYWRLRKEVFGARAFYPLDLSGNGAFDETDVQFVKRGSAVVLPCDEKSRPVGFVDRGRLTERNYTPGPNWEMQTMRNGFFLYSRLSENPVAQTDGIILITHAIYDGPSRHQHQRSTMVFTQRCFQRAFPLKLKAFHPVVILPSTRKPTFLESIMPAMLRRSGAFLRTNLVLHMAESSLDALSKLQQYGLSKQSLPPVLGGTWSYCNFDRYCLEMEGKQKLVVIEGESELSALCVLVAAATNRLTQGAESSTSGAPMVEGLRSPLLSETSSSTGACKLTTLNLTLEEKKEEEEKKETQQDEWNEVPAKKKRRERASRRKRNEEKHPPTTDPVLAATKKRSRKEPLATKNEHCYDVELSTQCEIPRFSTVVTKNEHCYDVGLGTQCEIPRFSTVGSSISPNGDFSREGDSQRIVGNQLLSAEQLCLVQLESLFRTHPQQVQILLRARPDLQRMLLQTSNFCQSNNQQQMPLSGSSSNDVQLVGISNHRATPQLYPKSNMPSHTQCPSSTTFRDNNETMLRSLEKMESLAPQSSFSPPSLYPCANALAIPPPVGTMGNTNIPTTLPVEGLPSPSSSVPLQIPIPRNGCFNGIPSSTRIAVANYWRRYQVGPSSEPNNQK
jgi:hypothetical protein